MDVGGVCSFPDAPGAFGGPEGGENGKERGGGRKGEGVWRVGVVAMVGWRAGRVDAGLTRFGGKVGGIAAAARSGRPRGARRGIERWSGGREVGGRVGVRFRG